MFITYKYYNSSFRNFNWRTNFQRIFITYSNNTSLFGYGTWRWCAFRGCSSIIHVSLSSSLKTLNKHVFDFCSSITQIEIPSSVEVINEFAFGHCDSLANLKIPSSVGIIDFYAFYQYHLLKKRCHEEIYDADMLYATIAIVCVMRGIRC